MNVSEFLTCIEGKTGHPAQSTSDGWQSRCPAHDDSTPSLTIADKGGKILIHCHAGCTFNAVVESLGLKPTDLMPPKEKKKGRGPIAKVYDYRDLAGNIVHQTVRYEPKDFLQRRPDPENPGQFVWSLDGVQTVLYRLPEVEQAKFTGDTIFIVEGEKDADAMAEHGFCATCNPMGADSEKTIKKNGGHWKPQYTAALEGADCFIIPDKDETGRKHLNNVGQRLTGHVKRLRVIHLPDHPKFPVKDPADFFAAGFTAEDMQKLADEAKDWVPDTTAKETPSVNDNPKPDLRHEFGTIAGLLNGNASSISVVKESYFTDPRSVAILRALRQLSLDGKPVDIVTLIDFLTTRELLDPAGGEQFIRSLSSFYDSFPGHLAILADRSSRRTLKKMGDMLAGVVDDLNSDPRQILTQLKDVVEIVVTSSSGDDLDALLANREFNPSVVPPEIRPIYTLTGHIICTPGNLTAITASIKAGKTAAIAAMCASAMPHSPDADMLGFESSNTNQKALLHFDSEQSPDDHWHVVKRALKRAEQPEPPAWFHSYCLTGLGCTRAWSAVQRSIQANASKHSGIHSIFLDGVADLVNDVNNPSECNAFVAQLHDLAIHYDCPIIGVIHFNPSADGKGAKTRGHLGSQLERKAETNLRLDKTDEITTIWSDKQRRSPILKGSGPAFAWSQELKMHILTENLDQVAKSQERERLQSLAADVFTDHQSMRYTDIVKVLQSTLGVSVNTADSRLKELLSSGVVKKSFANLYVLNT